MVEDTVVSMGGGAMFSGSSVIILFIVFLRFVGFERGGGEWLCEEELDTDRFETVARF